LGRFAPKPRNARGQFVATKKHHRRRRNPAVVAAAKPVAAAAKGLVARKGALAGLARAARVIVVR
jgi:hypothetical protein